MTRAVFSNSFIALLALAAATVMTPNATLAASGSGERARTIPTGVFELLVGGSWEEKKKSGYYRAIALAAGQTGKEYAEVWLQWIEVGKKSAKVLKNIPIKEITKLNLPSLSLGMEVEESGSAVLLVTHYDEKTGEPTTHEFRTTTLGNYEKLEVQVAADQSTDSPATETK